MKIAEKLFCAAVRESAAISVENLSQRFRVLHERPDTLRGVFANLFRIAKPSTASTRLQACPSRFAKVTYSEL